MGLTRRPGASWKCRIFTSDAQRAAKEAADRLKQQAQINPRHALSHQAMHAINKEVQRIQCTSGKFFASH